MGGPNSDDWRKRLVVCLLSTFISSTIDKKTTFPEFRGLLFLIKGLLNSTNILCILHSTYKRCIGILSFVPCIYIPIILSYISILAFVLLSILFIRLAQEGLTLSLPKADCCLALLGHRWLILPTDVQAKPNLAKPNQTYRLFTYIAIVNALLHCKMA